MLYILTAALGVVVARRFHWIGIFAVSTILAVAIGVEGAIHDRTLLKVLRRDWEVMITLQASYAAHLLWDAYGRHLMARIGR
ncbi:hypothetical protein ACLBX9_12415 [Methylobacterium sp. A49B]|jgi:hypothetical protein|uniref:Uncharacterized protein n=1 Tax=Methylobacterium mesophilicum SR1.6/6 TaxID=908290 RepID=A0A6B9FQ98_9HYPH|nr:hypothetical protein [Methylobacterium mesophilicum]MBE7201083.1 hypothetical protein [Parafilimonas terrae]QGY04771.1 hypothetical protein MMSR116_24840 [Methylobacterium mesophilicum SR1.6/6]